MIILHLSMLDGRLQLWGETSAAAPSVGGPGKAKRTTAMAPEGHPFGASPDDLVKAARSLSINLRRNELTHAKAWLPSMGRQPIPSSPMLEEAGRRKGKIRLMPWRVHVAPLRAEAVQDLLCHTNGRRVLLPGVVAGADFSFWVEALGLAARLAAGQSFLPTVVACDDRLEARWLPVYRGEEAQELERVCARMPSSARCLATAESRTPPTVSAKTIVEEFVQSTLDRIVRTASMGPTRALRLAFDSVDDAWLEALTNADPRVPWQAGRRTDELQRRVDDWHRSLLATTHAAFRLCFRLEEPDTVEVKLESGVEVATGAWRVLYLIHPREDRSLLVPVEDLWESAGGQLSALSRFGGDVREYLLTALGQAAGLCPPIAASLERKNPGSFELDTAEAHEFLTHHAPALETAGFGVLLPAWWTGRGPRRRLGVRANAKSPTMQARAGLSLRQIVDVDWELALGDSKVSIDELYKLARLKTSLVRVRGQWLELDAAQIDQAAALFNRKKGGERIALGDLFRATLGAEAEVNGLPLLEVEADGWMAELLAKLQGDQCWREQPAPDGFQGTLRPYQARGYSWLSFLRQWGLGACLADDMGLGKTIQTLALIEREREAGETRPALLICPTSVLNNWLREAQRFTPRLRTLVHHGARRKRAESFLKAAAEADLVVSSYALLHRDLGGFQKMEWAGVILDEAQNIKNPETAQSKAARGLHGDYRIALTGTPVENHVGDLWAIMDFLNPGLLGRQSEFKKDFFRPIQLLRSPEATERLRRLTGPFILRRVKTDRSVISDLPDKMEMKTYCALTKEQASLYAAVVSEAEAALEGADGIQRKGVVLATLSKLKQVCNHPAQFLGDNSALEGRSGKLARLVEMLEEILESKERALVFTQFAQMGEILKRHLEESFGRETLFLHGSVPKRRRDELVERFQREGAGPPVFVLSLKAGGTGLNLTRASHVFHFDRWWNPAVENQATDRAFRIGQEKRVQVHKFICAGTMEERIDQMIEGKSSLATQVVGSGEGWLTRLSNEELKKVLALGKEAAGV